MSIQKKLDEWDFRYLQFVVGRAHGADDEQIVKELADPEIDSPQVLYRILKRDGYPVCVNCGDYSARKRYCDECEPAKPRRKARSGTGEAIELPPASDATFLFDEALRTLAEDVASLRFRREQLKDGRFVVTHEYPPEAKRRATIFKREKLPDEEWAFWCSVYGKDPNATDEFEVAHTTYSSRGASQHPPEPLTRLIGMYVLAGMPIENLVEKLHFEPEKLDRGQLQRQIDWLSGRKAAKRVGLIPQAERLARAVRGAVLKTGRDTGEATPLEHAASERIRVHRENIEVAKTTTGFGKAQDKNRYIRALEKKMYEELRTFYGLSKAEVDRIERLRLPSQRKNFRESTD